MLWLTLALVVSLAYAGFLLRAAGVRLPQQHHDEVSEADALENARPLTSAIVSPVLPMRERQP